MSVSMQIDATEFLAMVKELDTVMEVKGGLESIIEKEVGSILSKAIAETKKADKKRIEKTVMENLPTKHSEGWYRPVEGARERKWRLKNAEWRKYLAKKRRVIAERKRRVGLSAQTWVEIGKQLRAQVKAPAGVLKASVNKSPIRHKVSGTYRQADKNSATFVLSYQNPSGQWARAKPALQTAINGRVKYFKTNLATGAFKNAQRAAAKYKGVQVKRTF